jgi:hypothetical protein
MWFRKIGNGPPEREYAHGLQQRDKQVALSVEEEWQRELLA